jgi:hypothetical protein
VILGAIAAAMAVALGLYELQPAPGASAADYAMGGFVAGAGLAGVVLFSWPRLARLWRSRRSRTRG